jgi:hypothetical protein
VRYTVTYKHRKVGPELNVETVMEPLREGRPWPIKSK